MKRKYLIEKQGFCPICDGESVFRSRHAWFRDHLLCERCGSIPRERALMKIISEARPNFRNLDIHESSPAQRGVSTLMKRECSGYSCSYFFPDVERGQIEPRFNARCEDLENLTFEDSSFDLVITQDVLEHVFDPDSVFREIARVLRPGGAHIFTVPIVNKFGATRRRASIADNGQIEHLCEAQYHGNPVDAEGSLVTIDWGYDIASRIQSACGMPTVIVQIDDIEKGIRAEFIEVLISTKPQ